MIHQGTSPNHHKNQSTQFNEIEHKVNKLINGLLEVENTVQQITDNDHLHRELHRKQATPERVVGVNFCTLVSEFSIYDQKSFE